MWISQLAEISKELLTPVIAIVTVYIAWQQWQINKHKLKLDRYERRLRIYDEVRLILSIILLNEKASDDDLLKFHRAVSEADFLFGHEITSYIDEIYKHACALRKWFVKQKFYNQEKTVETDHQKICDGINSELEWLTNQFDPAKEKFKKYLDVSK